MTTLTQQIDKLKATLNGASQYLPGNDGYPPSWHLWKPNEVNGSARCLVSI